jgi:hypothetical protein
MSQDPQTLVQALTVAPRAIALNNFSPQGHALLGIVYLWQKQYEPAILEMERVVILSPDGVPVHRAPDGSTALSSDADGEEAVERWW